jgi:hypothetical protein
LPARSRTCRRSDRGIASGTVCTALWANFRFHGTQGLPPAAYQFYRSLGPRGVEPLYLLRQGLVLIPRCRRFVGVEKSNAPGTI